MEFTPQQKKEFGARLREMRRAAGLTAKEVAAALNARLPGGVYQHQHVTNWERGGSAPRSLAVVPELERMLGAPGQLMATLALRPAEDVRVRPASEPFEAAAEWLIEHSRPEALKLFGPRDREAILIWLRALSTHLDEVLDHYSVELNDSDFAVAAEGADAEKQKVGRKRNRPSPPPEPEGL